MAFRFAEQRNPVSQQQKMNLQKSFLANEQQRQFQEQGKLKLPQAQPMQQPMQRQPLQQGNAQILQQQQDRYKAQENLAMQNQLQKSPTQQPMQRSNWLTDILNRRKNSLAGYFR